MKITAIFRIGTIISLGILFYCSVLQAQSPPFEYGLGTAQFPYNISTPAHLATLAQLVNAGNTEYNNKYYRLENNITLSSYGSNFNAGKGWIPIGSDENPFLGSFDGNNKTISNLYINNPSAVTGSGLFGRLHGAKVKNLNVSDGNVTGAENTGGIAGYITYNSSIGSVGEISNSLFQGTVSGSGENVGGVAGRILNGRLVNCYATGTVSGQNNTGGIAGSSYGGSITNCAALNQSVKANGAGANVARVACAQTGMGASTLSGNFGFYEMVVTSNNTPKTISNNANGQDGASKTALELQSVSGYPNGFNVSPWVFTPGRLPGLGTAVVKPQYLAAIRLSLSVQRNGMAWNNHEKTFTLKLRSDETVTQTMSGTGSSLMAIVKQSGVWKVYEGNTDTGATITANEVTGEGTINYFTVSFSIINTGIASGSVISATYGGSSISSGATVLSGKQLVITATGAGATTYLYSWSGAGTSSQTTNSITIGFLDSRIDAQCVVTSSHAVTFSTVGGNGTLTATVDGISFTSGALVQYGKNVVFTATPNPNFRIREWKENSVAVNDTYTTYTAYNITKEHNITVEFEYITHEVTFYELNSFGALSATVDGTGIPTGTFVRQGRDVVFTASPNTGYLVKEWKKDGTVVPNNKTDSYTLQNLNAEATVTVEFEIITYEVTFSVVGEANGNGTLTVTADGEAITSNTEVEYGKKLVFTATPNANYRIKAWRDNNATVNGTSLTYEIASHTVSHIVTVEFEIITYAVTFSVLNGNGTLVARVDNSIITSGAQVQIGKNIEFTATPNTGYCVKGWIVDDEPIDNKDTNYPISGLNKAYHVRVEFEHLTYPVIFHATNPANGTLTATVGGTGITSGAELQHGTNIVFTASPNTGYRVKEWKTNGTIVENNNSVNYTLQNLTAETTVSVEFELVTYKINFNTVNGNGTLTATANNANITTGALAPHGSTLVFTATPGANYRVKQWIHNDEVVNGANTSYTITNLYDTHTVTVEYELVTYAVTFNVTGGNGSLTATVGGSNITSVAQVQHGSNIVFTATPNAGYRVKEWKKDGILVNGQNTSYTVSNLTAATTVTVEFEYTTYLVNFNVVNGNGSLTATVDGTGITNGDNVSQGKNIVFTASPANGYRVKEWKKDGAVVNGQNSNYQVSDLNAEITVTVEFESVTYLINYSVVNGNGTLTATANGTGFNSGTEQQQGKTLEFTATPDVNYRVKGWNHNGNLITNNSTTYTISSISDTHTITVEFELVTYSVTFSVTGGNGSLTATVDGVRITSVAQVQHNKSVIFTAAPNAGYRVKEWRLNNGVVSGNTADTYTLNNVTANATVTVEFEFATHPVTFSVTGGNGTVSATVDGTVITTGVHVQQGKNVVFTASPANGYRVKEWRLNNATVTGNTSINYTLQNVTATSNVTVEFELVTYTINFNVVNNNGSLTATENGTVVVTGAQVQHGKALLFTATPNVNYRVKAWKDNNIVVNGTNETYTINSLSDTHTVTVEFELVTYAVTFSVKGSNGSLTATVNGSNVTSVAQVAHGGEIVFTAKPDAGYRVKEWKKNETETINGTATTCTVSDITAATAITVEFEYTTFQVNFSVAGSNGTLTATVDGTGISSGEQVQQGKNIVFTANPAGGYRVKEWKNGNAVSSNKTNTYTLSNLMAIATITVEFEPVTYVINFSCNTGGSLTASVGSTTLTSGGTAQHGSTVTFTATANTNYRIKEWKDNNLVVNGTNGTYTIGNLSETHTVTVEYEFITYAVSFNVVNGNGTLTATVDDGSITSGAQVQRTKNIAFVATPNTGFKVKEWKVNGSVVSDNTTNNYTLNNLTEASTVTVEFERITYEVNFNVTGSNGTITARVDNALITNGMLIEHGKDIVFTASPASGFRVKEWRKDNTVVPDNKTNNYTLSGLTAGVTITVEFEADTWAVNFIVTGTAVSGGSITARVDGNNISNDAQVLRGKSVVFTASPPNNCTRVKEWRFNNSIVQGNTSNSYTLTNLDAAASVTVEFETAPCSAVSFNVVNGNGTLTATVDDVTITTGTSVPNGKSVVFTAAPSNGYRVKEWRSGGTAVPGNTSNNYTLPNLVVATTVTVEFEELPPAQHLVSFSVVNFIGGTLTATVDGISIVSGTSVTNGKSIVFTATPSTGYHIKGWTPVNGTNPNYTIIISASQEVTVEFAINTYTVNFNTANDFGTINATVEGSTITSGASVEHGKNVAFTTVPNDGYRVKEWQNGGKVVGDKSNSYTLTNLSEITTVSVEFEPIKYTVTFNVNGGIGTFTATDNSATINTGAEVQHGNRVVFTANPADGYRIKEWKDNDETVNGTATTYAINSFTVAHNVTVEFEPLFYPVTFNVQGGNGTLKATVDGQPISSGAQVQHGKNVIFTAEPSANYRVKEWKDNTSTVNGTATVYPLNNYRTAHNVTVEFEMITFTVSFNVTGSNGTLDATVDGSGISTGTTVQQGKHIVFMASPTNGYRVKEWKFNGITVPNNTTNTLTLEYLYADAQITVEFEITTLLLTFNVQGGNGTLTATNNNASTNTGTLITYGNRVAFTATANTGYCVKEWKDNSVTVNGTATTYTINSFTLAHNVTVEFEPITYRITFNVNGGNGRLTAKVNGTDISSGDQVANIRSVEFTAEPNIGYRVKEWKRGNETVQGNTTNNYTLSGFNANTTVTVEFERVTHQVTFSVTGSNGTLAASVEGSGISSDNSVQQGRDIVFTANPNNGYSVKEWKVNGTVVSGYTANSYTHRSLSGTTNVTVEFEPLTLRLRYEVVGGNGTLTATVDNVNIGTNTLVEHGKNVVFKATPNGGYRIKEWKDNGETINSDNDTYTINGFATAHTVQIEFERISYTVVFNTINNYGSLRATVDGSLITSGDRLPDGSNILFTATPNSGYRVKEWKDNAVTVNGTATTYPVNNLSSEHTVTVEFELITYPVTYSVEGDNNGVITATVNGSGISSGAEVRQGRNIVFMANPHTGYRVKEWKLNGKTVPDNTSNSYTLQSLNADAEVTVVFELTTLLLTYLVTGDEGVLTAKVNNTDILSNRLVTFGSSVVFTATPKTGYRVKEWKDNGVSVNYGGFTYTINSFTVAHHVTVEFEPIPYNIIFNVNGGNGTLRATVDGSSIVSGAQVSFNKNIVFTARPNTGYRVKEWIDNGNKADGVIGEGSGNETYTISGLDKEHIVTVEFVMVTHPVTFSVTGSNGSLAATVDDLGISTNEEVQQGKNIVFMANPDNGYCVKEWKVNGDVVPEYTANNYTLRRLSDAAHVTVEFERTTLILRFEVVGSNGMLTALVDNLDFKTDNLVEQGKTVVLTAKPDDGYQIKEWKDNGETVNGDNTTYTINGFAAAHTILVEFEPITCLVIFNSLNSNGSLTAMVDGSPITSGDRLPHGSNIVFTAEPDAGYRVKGWLDNNASVSGEAGEAMKTEIYSITGLDMTHNVTVDFELVTFPVTFRAESNGSLTATVDNISIVSGESVMQGKTIVFSASPYNGYSVKEWKLNGNGISGYTAMRYTLDDLSEAVDITVEFAPTILTLTYGVIGDYGTLTATYAGSDDPITSGSLLNYGKNVVFTATPDEGFQIKVWKDNGETVNGVNTNYTIPDFTTAHTVWVEFEPVTYLVMFNVVNGNGILSAMVDGDEIKSSTLVQHDRTIVFTAEPDEGYRVKEWISNGTPIEGDKTTYELNNLSDMTTVTVEFELCNYPVTFSVVNGNGTIDASVGGVVNIESGSLVPHGRSIEFTARPSDDYFVVKEWKLNGMTIEGNKSNIYLLITLTDAATVTVEFEMKPVTIETNSLPDGKVGIIYSQILSATSSEPVTWSITDGNLPDGLILSGNGEISGEPKKTGTFTFTVKAECNVGRNTKQLTCTIEKGDGATVEIPVKNSTTTSSITINAIRTCTNGQLVEYAIATSDNADTQRMRWQTELIFGNLTAYATYYVYARSKENDDYFAGEVSVSMAIITDGSTGIEDIQAIPLKGYVQGGRLYVSGLTEGKQWRVYSISGMLLYRGIAVGDEENISLSAQGMFIIQSETRMVKVVNYGQ